MGERFSAVARAIRTFVQGAVAAGALAAAEAVHTAITSGTFNPRFVIMAVITTVVGAVVTYVFNVVAPRGTTAPPSVEGIVAFVRTGIQTIAAVGLVAAWDAIYALITGGVFNPADLGKAALAAGVTAVVAALHNMFDSNNSGRTRLAQ